MHPITNVECGARRGEQGMALFVAVLILVLVGAIAVAAVDFSEQELTASGRSRASSRNLYAADAGIEFALNRLTMSPVNLSSFDFTLADGARVQSRRRSDGAPQALNSLGQGPPPEGYSINVGTGATYTSELYLVNVTATAPGGSTTELEVKVNAVAATSGGY